MGGRGRTGVVLAAAVLLLVAAAVVGLSLFRSEVAEGDDAARATWDDFRPIPVGLLIHGSRSSCQDVTAVDVVETAESIEVTLDLSRRTEGCDDPAVALRRKVELDEPLGDRPVYDGGCLADGGSAGECRRYEREVATG